jgi:sec-independent protein translocase protein TatA
MGSFSLWHWIIVLVVVLLLFGRGKISDLMGDVAKGINSFKKGLKEDDDVAGKTIEQNASETTHAKDKSSAV